MNSTENSPSSPTSPESIQQQLDSLRKLFVVTLLVLLCFTAAVDFYLARQVKNVRDALAPQALAIEQFTKNEMPNIQAFVVSLQTFAKTHPDINPILEKYDILPKPNSTFSAPAPKAK